MQLTVDDTTVENPAEGDIVRLVPDAPPHADWALTLVQGDDDWIEADATDDGRYDASYSFRGTFYSAEGPVSGAELRRVLTRYLSGDAGWRQGIKWKKWKPEAESAAKTGTSALAGWRTYLPVAAGLGGLVLIWMIEAVGGRLLWSFPLPAAIDSEPARIFLGFFALVVALFAGVLIWKLIEARRAARWPQAVGRITKSEAGFELTRSNSENMPRNERVANIAYEFQVNGRTYRSTRFTLSEKVSEDEVAGFLERFPLGKTVPVYYDPANPENCTLDRDVPQGVMLGCLVALGLGIAMLAVAMLAVTRGPDLLKTALPDAILPLVVMFAFAGLIALIVAVTILKSAMAARRWPRTPGTVTLSEVHDFEMRSRSTSNGRTRIRWHTSYMPVVEYTYSVAGRRYTSRAVRLGTEVAGSESYARKLADRYPVGKMVSVFYDPKQPEQSALEIRSTLGWFMLGLAAILAILAAWAAGAFSNGPPL